MRRCFFAVLVCAFPLVAVCETVVKVVDGSTNVSIDFRQWVKTTADPNTSPVVTDYYMSYREAGAAPTSPVAATALAAWTTSHTDNFCFADSNGIVRADFPDAAFDGGVGTYVSLIIEDGTGEDLVAPVKVELIAAWQTGDSFARLGAPAGASMAEDLVVIDNFVDDLESRLGTPSDLGGGATVAANLSDIEAQTDDIGAAGAGLTEAGGTGDHLTALATQASMDDVPTVSEFNARTLAASAYFDPNNDTVDVGLIEGTDATDALDAASGGGSISDKMNPEHEIASVTSQQVFVLSTGPTIDDLPNKFGMWALILDDSGSDNDYSLHKITDYVGSTKTLDIQGTPEFTVGADDSIILMTPDKAVTWLIERIGR